jgi:cytochrome c556
MRSFHLLLGCFLGAGLLSACASNTTAQQPPQQAQLANAVAAPDRTTPPEPLSPAARAILKKRMASHAQDMADLVSAIMLLDYPRIAGKANSIASDVNLSRPLTHDATELNASLPEKFFVHQDNLRTGARSLAAAAGDLDPYRVAAEYGRLSEGCVRCHADFRPSASQK